MTVGWLDPVYDVAVPTGAVAAAVWLVRRGGGQRGDVANAHHTLGVRVSATRFRITFEGRHEAEADRLQHDVESVGNPAGDGIIDLADTAALRSLGKGKQDPQDHG
jgi:hypothetical protein